MLSSRIELETLAVLKPCDNQLHHESQFGDHLPLIGKYVGKLIMHMSATDLAHRAPVHAGYVQAGSRGPSNVLLFRPRRRAVALSIFACIAVKTFPSVLG